MHMTCNRRVPTTCRFPVCNNDATLCPGQMLCEPVPFPGFEAIDAACIYIFTIEYCVKLFSVWAVDSRYGW